MIPENSQNIKYWGIFKAILTPIVVVVEIAFFPIERVLDEIESLIIDDMEEENLRQSSISLST